MAHSLPPDGISSTNMLVLYEMASLCQIDTVICIGNLICHIHDSGVIFILPLSSMSSCNLCEVRYVVGLYELLCLKHVFCTFMKFLGLGIDDYLANCHCFE